VKISLTPEAVASLLEIMNRIVTLNSSADKKKSHLASEVIIKFSKIVDDRQLSDVADRMVSPESRYKTLLQKLKDLSQENGDEALRSLEGVIRKFDQPSKKRKQKVSQEAPHE